MRKYLIGIAVAAGLAAAAALVRLRQWLAHDPGPADPMDAPRDWRKGPDPNPGGQE